MNEKRRPMRRLHHEEIGLQIAPMVDVTLLLLFFFMLTGKIAQNEKMRQIKLPVAESAVIPDDVSGRDIINIDEQGRYFAGERAVNYKELRSYLKQRLIEVPPLRLYVRADAKTPAKQIKDVMKACAEAGAVEVIFGTTH
jgi:biopolymer transport protein ExbD